MNEAIQMQIELTVVNHPGVMARITMLFARRNFNLEGILCGPIGGSKTSRVILAVRKDHRLPQIIAQLSNLYDVLDVKLRDHADSSLFEAIGSGS